MGFLEKSFAAASRLVKSEDDGKRQIIQLSLACSHDRNTAAARLLHQADTAARRLETKANAMLVLASQVGPLTGLGAHHLADRLTKSPQAQIGIGLVATVVASGSALVFANERTQDQRNQAREIRDRAISTIRSAPCSDTNPS